MNKLNELQENPERQFDELRNKIYEPNVFFSRRLKL